MNTNATVSIRSVRNSDESDVIELMCEGSFYEKNGNFYILYNEKEEMGMADCSVMVKISPKEVVVSRKGAFSSKMTYIEGKSDEFIYNMPYGVMPIVISTKKVEFSFDDNGGKLMLLYDINIQNQIDTNEMVITVKKDV